MLTDGVLQRLDTVRREDHGVAVELEVESNELADVFFVVDDEDGGHAGSRGY